MRNIPQIVSGSGSKAHRHTNTESDSEILLNILADGVKQSGKSRGIAEDCFQDFEENIQRTRGKLGCTAIAGLGLMGFRDPYGIRAIVIDSRKVEGGTDYVIALRRRGLGVSFWVPS